MNRPITLNAFVSTLFLWTLYFGMEAAASPKSANQKIQDANQGRKQLTDLEKKFYISTPDLSYSGLQFNLDYLVSDYVQESNLEVTHRSMLRAYRTLALPYSRSDNLYLAFTTSTKSMTDITAPEVPMK
jgi:hypothetical protein